MSDNIRVHDSGVVFVINIHDESGPVNLSTVENIDIHFQKPDRSVIQRVGEVINASSGIVRYISQYQDFDQAGRWKIQTIVRFANHDVKHSNVGTIVIEPNLSL